MLLNNEPQAAVPLGAATMKLQAAFTEGCSKVASYYESTYMYIPQPFFLFGLKTHLGKMGWRSWISQLDAQTQTQHRTQ